MNFNKIEMFIFKYLILAVIATAVFTIGYIIYLLVTECYCVAG